MLTVIKKATTPLIQKEIESELRLNGLKNIDTNLPKLLRALVDKQSIFIHPRRRRGLRNLDAYSATQCRENLPEWLLEKVPTEGIGMNGLVTLAKAELFSSSEIEKALQGLKRQQKLRTATGPRNKLLLFRVI